MKRRERPNLLSGTVTRFISKDLQRWRRQRQFDEQRGHDPRRDKDCAAARMARPKKPKESRFVKFMNKLEDRGPQKPGSLHEKWAKAIREKMTADGIWPTGMAEWNVEFLALYLQQLQRQFWNSLHPFLKRHLLPEHCSTAGWTFIGPANHLLKKHRVSLSKREAIFATVGDPFSTFHKMYDMIRRKGMRDKLFIMSYGCYNIRFVRILIDEYPTDNRARWYWRWESCTIESHVRGQVVPFLVMPHKYARIDMHCGDPEKNIKMEYEYLRHCENVFVF